MNIEDDGTNPSVAKPPEAKEEKDANLRNSSEFPFNFPFQPYEIQVELMQVAYETFEDRKFALLESPTGTGKSLSMICSALTWLRDHQKKTKREFKIKKNQLTERIERLKNEEESSCDWLSIQTERQRINQELIEANQELNKIIASEHKTEARWLAKLHNIPMEQFLLTYKSKPTTEDIPKAPNNEILEEVSPIDTCDDDIEKQIKEQEVEQIRPKIFYASRTHSQLSQFIGEIKKTRFAQSNGRSAPIKVSSLGSRANLCIYPEVLRLKDSNAINEKCSELQRETNAQKRCPYLKLKQVAVLKEEILSSVSDIEDIVSKGRALGACPYYATRMAVPESEVVVLPYNNLLHQETRKASTLNLDESVIILDESHNILETICSIHSVSITGEQLIASHLLLTRYHNKFLRRLSPKNAELIKNIVRCLTFLLRFLNDPKKHVDDYENSAPSGKKEDSPIKSSNTTANNIRAPSDGDDIIIDATKFALIAKIEKFNIFHIVDYFARSQLARKLIGFHKQDSSLDLKLNLSDPKDDESNSEANDENGCKADSVKPPNPKKCKTTRKVVASKKRSIRPEYCTNLSFLDVKNRSLKKKSLSNATSYPIYTLVEFFRSLTNLAQDGRILTKFVDGSIDQSSIKFLLLNPSSQFKHMIQEARSIVLAGGTMQPFNEFTDLLFRPLGVDCDRLTIQSCNHIIDKEQLFVATLTNGPSGKPLELSYKTRSSSEMVDEIGRTVMNIANVVPGGMVCFFPSYDYEQMCFQRWSMMGFVQNIEKNSKQVFREPKHAHLVKEVLEEYSMVIERGKQKKRGAMLLSVVGGKMSEGINFNDDLGRCVVMIGLPYANIRSAELRQKMTYYDENCPKPSSGERGMSAGQQYYENLCIKGVNQSIGRAIRHKRDYAAIILLDRRYSGRISIKNGLAGWLRQAMVEYNKFGPMFLGLGQFFARMSQKSNLNMAP